MESERKPKTWKEIEKQNRTHRVQEAKYHCRQHKIKCLNQNTRLQDKEESFRLCSSTPHLQLLLFLVLLCPFMRQGSWSVDRKGGEIMEGRHAAKVSRLELNPANLQNASRCLGGSSIYLHWEVCHQTVFSAEQVAAKNNTIRVIRVNQSSKVTAAQHKN